jgi:hypothetical protein
MKALLVIALLATAAPAFATQESNVIVTGPQEPKICRRIGPSNSSATRISHRRVCLTQQQWRERSGGRDNTQEAADTLDVLNPGNSTGVPNADSPADDPGGPGLSRQINGGLAPR